MQQTNGRKDVEILGLCDNYSWSIGKKRSSLLSIATGKFISFVDDDDEVSGDYVEAILSAIRSSPTLDMVSFKLKMYAGNFIEYDADKHLAGQPLVDYTDVGGDTINDYFYLQTSYAHLYAWRRELVKGIEFLDISFGEDEKWASKALQCVKEKHHIDKFLYEYRFDPLGSESRNEAPV